MHHLSIVFTAAWISLIFAVLAAVLGGGVAAIKAKSGDNEVGIALTVFFPVWIVTFFIDWIWIYVWKPPFLEANLWPLIMVNLIVMVIIGACYWVGFKGVNGTAIGAGTIAVLFLFHVVYVINTDVMSDTKAKQLAHMVHVTNEVNGKIENVDTTHIPDTDANHMVIVSTEVATYKAKQDLASGEAGQMQANTYFKLGSATLESISGHMWYVFQLEFDGSGNKHRQHNVIPGYIMIDAEDPNTEAVQHLGVDALTGIDYRMHVGLNAGQSQDAVRYVYTHGFGSYQLDDPTLEVDDSGKPYISVTLNRPAAKWGYSRPEKMVLVNANTGAIQVYSLKNVPAWIDRVYSKSDAVNMMNTWGYFDQAPFKFAGGTNAGRFKVSGDPELVYTQGGYAAWRMLLTSYNNDSSVNYIVLFDTRSNNVQIYTPQNPVGTEDAVLHSFESTATGGVKSSGYQADGLTLHMIYGQLTWVVSYVSTGDNGKATFQGVGLLNAYDNNGSGVIVATTKEAALQQYQTQIAAGDNNNAPVQGAKKNSVSGKITSRVGTVEGGQSYIYLIINGDKGHTYKGAANSSSPDLIFSKVGDEVTFTYLNLTTTATVQSIESFSDSAVGLSVH